LQDNSRNQAQIIDLTKGRTSAVKEFKSPSESSSLEIRSSGVREFINDSHIPVRNIVLPSAMPKTVKNVSSAKFYFPSNSSCKQNINIV
jgi:D-aminopeptidase